MITAARAATSSNSLLTDITRIQSYTENLIHSLDSLKPHLSSASPRLVSYFDDTTNFKQEEIKEEHYCELVKISSRDKIPGDMR